MTWMNGPNKKKRTYQVGMSIVYRDLVAKGDLDRPLMKRSFRVIS